MFSEYPSFKIKKFNFLQFCNFTSFSAPKIYENVWFMFILIRKGLWFFQVVHYTRGGSFWHLFWICSKCYQKEWLIPLLTIVRGRSCSRISFSRNNSTSWIMIMDEHWWNLVKPLSCWEFWHHQFSSICIRLECWV